MKRGETRKPPPGTPRVQGSFDSIWLRFTPLRMAMPNYRLRYLPAQQAKDSAAQLTRRQLRLDPAPSATWCPAPGLSA